MSDTLKNVSCNLGWSHIVPATSDRKICLIILSVVGIPITVMLTHTVSKLFLKGMKDFLLIILTYEHTPICYAERIAKISAKGCILPRMILVLLIFWFVTSIAVAIAGIVIFRAMLLALLEQGDVIHLWKVDKLDLKSTEAQRVARHSFHFVKKVIMRLLICRNSCFIVWNHEIIFFCYTY